MTYEGARWPLDRDAQRRAQEMDRLLNGGPLVKCGRCGHEYREYAVGECPRPGVRKKYGPHLCIYCCRLCEHHREAAGGQRFGYEKSILNASALTHSVKEGGKQ